MKKILLFLVFISLSSLAQTTINSNVAIPRLTQDSIFFYLGNTTIPTHKYRLFAQTPNGISFLAKWDNNDTISETYYSIGGGFIVKEGELQEKTTLTTLPFPINTAADLLHWCLKTGGNISDIVLENCIIEIQNILYGIVLYEKFEIESNEKISFNLYSDNFINEWLDEPLNINIYNNHKLIYSKKHNDKSKCFIILSNKFTNCQCMRLAKYML